MKTIWEKKCSPVTLLREMETYNFCICGHPKNSHEFIELVKYSAGGSHEVWKCGEKSDTGRTSKLNKKILVKCKCGTFQTTPFQVRAA